MKQPYSPSGANGTASNNGTLRVLPLALRAPRLRSATCFLSTRPRRFAPRGSTHTPVKSPSKHSNVIHSLGAGTGTRRFAPLQLATLAKGTRRVAPLQLATLETIFRHRMRDEGTQLNASMLIECHTECARRNEEMERTRRHTNGVASTLRLSTSSWACRLVRTELLHRLFFSGARRPRFRKEFRSGSPPEPSSSPQTPLHLLTPISGWEN